MQVTEQLDDDYKLRALTVDNDLTQEKKIHFNARFFIVFDRRYILRFCTKHV